ncbi:MAG: three-Cys-motif partner protein TcmP [Candidatus Marinimicrobia bacterium]|nr:three-Cys-motif partner protein TcmP [Candidatus Neomarinimicrobiota bacterium]
MHEPHKFGGSWTQDKLERLRKYLDAYMKIFSANPRAKYLDTMYIDAFAGTGFLQRGDDEDGLESLFMLSNDEDAQSFLKGSAQIALETKPPFSKYIFIERNERHAEELNLLKNEFSDLENKIQIIKDNANKYLPKLCTDTNWNNRRAVVFLDPYGMQVKWSTIQALAETQAVDLWILFPLGLAVNRLLKRNTVPKGAWAERLTDIFGTDSWINEFYEKSQQTGLFEGEMGFIKTTNFDGISRYFVKRLKTIFEKVAENPLPLVNSRNNPLYLLCFAASNPKGAPTAVKIAQNILGK